MYDRLQDTPVYKEMTRLATEKAWAEARRESETALQEALKAVVSAQKREWQEAEARRAAEAALEKERREERKALREVALALVQQRFPTLLRLTRQVTKGIEPTSTFQALLLQISTASTPEELHQYLLTVGEEENEQ